MNKHEETAYTVSRSAIEKIARTAALGTEGVAKEKGSSFSVRQKTVVLPFKSALPPYTAASCVNWLWPCSIIRRRPFRT